MSQFHGSGSSNSHYNRSGEDGLLVFGLCVVVIGAGLYAAWWFHHTQISAAVIALAHWQMQVIGQFTDCYANLDAQVLARDPASVKPAALWHLLHDTGLFFRIPAVVAMLVLAVWCFLRNAPSRFTRNLDLPGLMRTQAETFPSAAAFVHRDLKLVPPAAGRPRPSDPALHLREWVDRFARTSDGIYVEHRAVAELKRQLGPDWHGVTDAQPHVRGLFAAFALHAARRRTEAVAFLGELSRSLPDGSGEGPSGPDMPLAFSSEAVARADAILSDATVCVPCVQIAARHGYTASAMMAVLSHARAQAGVLAPAQFAFLKLLDRPLWYALHSLGFPGGQNRAEQPNPRIEALGARDHWAAECDAGGPLLEPSLDRAVAVLRAKAGNHIPLTLTQSETIP